jgi:hypothetical protein
MRRDIFLNAADIISTDRFKVMMKVTLSFNTYTQAPAAAICGFGERSTPKHQRRQCHNIIQTHACMTNLPSFAEDGTGLE